MTYQEKINRLEQILREIESQDAISMDLYRAKAEEAKALIEACRKDILGMENSLNELIK